MPFENIATSIDQFVLSITINRPDKLNALNQATLSELSTIIQRASEDDGVRVVTLTGAGEKAFVAGADISEIQHLNPIQARRFSQFGQQLMLDIQNLGKPVIAAINGYALGGGCELALACSIRIAGEQAMLGLPEIKLGIMPGFGGTQRLARLIGAGRALHMALSGAPIDAQQALAYGLVTEVVPPNELSTATDRLASALASAAPHAMEGILDSINKGSDLPLEAGLELETDRFALCCATEDMREGTSAFLEKRKAQFSGN